MHWCSTAAHTAVAEGAFGALSSRELELELLRVAERLPAPAEAPATPSGRWLHVLTEAYGTFGHTNVCRRWIQLDASVVHDVVLLRQFQTVPENLVAAVEAQGGRCHVLERRLSLVERAEWLRREAREHADVVVLHTHPDEVVGEVAFGVPGGPPIVVLNHAAYLFWPGIAIADVVVNLRSFEDRWTRDVRGTTRSTVLPIPLLDDASGVSRRASEDRRATRERLGVPQDAVLALTSGQPWKYRPIAPFDFVETAREIAARAENVYILVVGPRDEGPWRAARRASAGRIRALGYRYDVPDLYAAADLYLDSFPVGSPTGLLDAAAAGLPCVVGPPGILQVFRNHDLIPEAALRPVDLPTYVETVGRLARDAPERAELGRRLEDAVRGTHSGDAWLAGLDELKAMLPARHAIDRMFTPGSFDAPTTASLLQLASPDNVLSRRQLLERAFYDAARRTASRPTVEPALWQALGPPGSSVTLVDRLALRRLNHRVRSRSSRELLLAEARHARSTGRRRAARRLVRRCAWRSPTVVLSREWLEEVVRLHVGERTLAHLRRLRRPPDKRPG